ncbi:MAG: hypothetical protein A2W33_08065 [Chloroflexi bacterium RBG_16_52_11]|nr:MAG: hypothetical protein A2W33_08065 [Chloroflexi bacterium RBG_16_52_11]
MRTLAHPATPPWQDSTVVRLVFFTLGVLALLSIAAIIFPGAEIKLAPEIRSQQIDLEIRANPALEAINLSGTVPAAFLKTTVKGKDSTPSTGLTRIPDKPASAQIEFKNLTNVRINIPSGTIVRTPGDHPIRFSTSRSGEVQAGPGKTVTILAQSIEPGERGNLPPASLTILEGMLSTRLAANNPNPARGGTTRTAPAPTNSQRQQLYTQLSDKLSQAALTDFEKQIAPDDLLLPATLTVTQVLEQNYDPAENQPADALNLDLNLEIQAMYTTAEHMQALAAGVLDANLPNGFIPVPDTINIHNLSEPVIGEDGLAHWQIRASRQIRADIPESQVRSAVLGATPTQAYDRLVESLSLEKSPLLRLQPGWWPWMPFLPFRVTVQVEDYAP